MLRAKKTIKGSSDEKTSAKKKGVEKVDPGAPFRV